jgi:hypothetical protein
MTRPAPSHSVYFDEAWQTESLEADMTRNDLITVLERLRFRNGLLTIKIDRETRDYLVRILRER